MKSGLAELQAKLGYVFRDVRLLEEALTHPSYLPEHPELTTSNQRLEFLGDAVLHLILTDALYDLYPSEREGALSKRRAALTKGVFLTGLARDFGIDRHLRISAGEEATGGRSRAAALEDAWEAVVGAIYRDSDLATVRSHVLAWYGNLPSLLANVEAEENPKGRLQELVQPQHGNTALRYEVTGTDGQDHSRTYEVAVYLNDRLLGKGRGSSKKHAEEAAAREGLAFIATKPDVAAR